MKNRDQIAWVLNWSEYGDHEVAGIVSEILYAAGVAFLNSADKERLEKWLGLDCDPETNNWGVLEDDEDDEDDEE